MLYIKKLNINNDEFTFFLSDKRIFKAKIDCQSYASSRKFLQFNNCDNAELFKILGINKWLLCNSIGFGFYKTGDWPESDKEHIILLAKALVEESKQKYIESCPEI